MTGMTARTEKRALCGLKLRSPDCCQKIKYCLGCIRAASAKRRNEHARQRRTGAPRHVKNDRVETNSVSQVTGGYDIGDHRCACRLLKSLDHCHSEGGRVHMPRLDLPGDDKQSQPDQHQAVNNLGNQYLCLARIAIGCASCQWGQQERRNGLYAAHQAELERRIRQLVNQPTASDLIHPERHGCERMPQPEQTKLAMAERSDGVKLN